MVVLAIGCGVVKPRVWNPVHIRQNALYGGVQCGGASHAQCTAHRVTTDGLKTLVVTLFSFLDAC